MAGYRGMENSTTLFLESFPTYRFHSKPGRYGLWVFSSKDENNPYSLDDAATRTMTHDKIISAFSKIYYPLVMDNYNYRTIVQFWAPVTIGGKLQLSTSGQPFAVSWLCSHFEKYRRLCLEHVYDIDLNSKFRGTPASAFLNRFPEMAHIHHEVDPFLGNALQECRLKTSFMMPIYCPFQTSSSSDCIGVIECTSWIPFIELFNQMNMKIKEVGLTVYNVQDRIPYTAINDPKLARDQIQDALKIVCQSHDITLAQVWIASLDENHVHFSSSLEEAQTRRLLGHKLTGYKNIDEDSIGEYSIDEGDEDSTRSWFFQNYYDACDLIPLQTGEELVPKTLQDYEPRFCKDISKLGIYKLMGWDWYAATQGSMGLTICMKSIHTGYFNYVFEFLWKHNSFNPIMLEELLLMIKSFLPSFKFASGTEIGDKLHVIEADNSTDKEFKKFDIFQAKRLSPIPEALKERNKQVAVDYIAPLDTNCKTAQVLVPQQVIEQQSRTSTTENFLENIFGDGNPMADRDDERLSDFNTTPKGVVSDLLETLPTCILHKKPETEGTLQVFCGEDEGSQKNLSSEKRLSPVPEAMNKGKKAMVVNYHARSKVKRDTTKIKLSREDIEQHYGKTQKEAADELDISLSTLKRKHNKLGMPGWKGPDLPQRKAYNSNKNRSKESHTHIKDNGVIQDPSPVNRNENTVIKAEFADDIIKLHLRISEATFVTVENEIGKKFKLKHGTFKIKYLDEDEEWILMTSDQDLSDCIQNSRER